MTRQRTFKRKVRGRMAKTGESYAAARLRLIAKARDLWSEAGATDPVEGLATGSGSSLSRYHQQLLARRSEWVKSASGRAMPEWSALLDLAGCRGKPHNAIWRWLAAAGHVDDGGLREAIVITYEQLIGRRQPGQSCFGDFPANVTRVLGATMDEALQRWLRLVGDRRTFNGSKLASEPRVTQTDRFRYWRANFADATKLTVIIWQMPNDRVSLGIQHRAFPRPCRRRSVEVVLEDVLGAAHFGPS